MEGVVGACLAAESAGMACEGDLSGEERVVCGKVTGGSGVWIWEVLVAMAQWMLLEGQGTILAGLPGL